ncbi:MAG: hypothetical protein ACLPX9_17235 [Rhodomicrobium sp.]
MKVLRSLAVSALLMFAGSGAFAQIVDDDTKCEVLESLGKAPSPGYRKIAEAASYIEETMRALDRLHGRKGKAEILPQMTQDGRSLLVQAVISRCHSRQAITIADTAIETYETVRAAGSVHVLDQTAQKPAWSRHSQTATPRRVPVSDSTGQHVQNKL